MLSDDDRADFQMADRLGPWPGERGEKPAQMRSKAAKALLLQPISEGAGEKVFR